MFLNVLLIDFYGELLNALKNTCNDKLVANLVILRWKLICSLNANYYKAGLKRQKIIVMYELTSLYINKSQP